MGVEVDLHLPLYLSTPVSITHICPAGVCSPSSALQERGGYGKQEHVSTCERPLWWMVAWVRRKLQDRAFLVARDWSKTCALNPPLSESVAELVFICLSVASDSLQPNMRNQFLSHLNWALCSFNIFENYNLHRFFFSFELYTVQKNVLMISCEIPGSSQKCINTHRHRCFLVRVWNVADVHH